MIKLGKILTGAKLYFVDSKLYILIKKYIDAKIAEIEVPVAEITKEAVDTAIGVSEEGAANKFYNEQGDFIEIESGESGESEAEFQISVMKTDCEFKGDWIKISHTQPTNAKRVIVRRATVEDSNGEQELDLLIAYPSAETYTGTNIYQGFYIQDRNGLISKTADWDVLNFEYDIESDTQIKYSFLNHETGINVISDHRKDSTGDTGNEMHAMGMRCMFTAVFPEFKGDYIDTYIDPDANYAGITTSFEPTYYEKKRACILMRPYTYAALNDNYSSSADFLEIGAHSDNQRGGNPPYRSDITPKADVFLSHSIAVGAKEENSWDGLVTTNWGYGTEFFEITRTDYLVDEYPERGLRIYPHIALQIWSNADRTVVWTEYAPHQETLNSFPDILKVGDIVFINVPLPAPTFGGTHPAEWTFLYNPASVKRTITAVETIDGTTYFTLDGAIWDTQLNGNKYLWAFTPGGYSAGNRTGSTQSPATMIVGAKFAKIKQETGLGLRLIREACRATAVLINDTTVTSQSYSGATTSINVADTTEFPDEGIIRVNGYDFVYTSKTATSFIGESQTVICGSSATVTLIWDMWRGFGQIDVDAAISYLEEHYIDNDDYKATVQRPKVNPVLEFGDLGENDAVAKRHVSRFQTKSLYFENKTVAVGDFVADTTYADYGYKAVISCAGVTSTMLSEVTFAPTEADSGNYAAVCLSGTGTVTIYAKAIPIGTITILTIKSEPV